ncbi:MAG TPA: MFS transporter [Gaiellaceae bacterium]|nr:MFS transporter [Gaiellaceae bacterium]
MTRQGRYTLIATILGTSMAFIDGSVVNVALKAMQNDLGGGLAAQQWWIDAYLLTLGSLILVGGSLGDIFGEVRIFTLGVASFGLASVLCAVAPDANTLIVFRGLQGIAGALLTPASLAVITSTFSGTERGAAIGTWTAWSGISFVIGPLVGGWLIGLWTWRVIFLINIPIAIATLVLARTHMLRQEAEGKNIRVDIPGAALCAAGLGLVVAAFIEQPRFGWSDPLVAGGLAGGAALLAAFVVYEMHAAMPMLPLRFFAKRNFSVTNIETFAVYGALSGWGVFTTLFLLEFAGYSPLKSGLATLPVTIVMFVLSPRIGRLSMRYGPHLFMAVGPALAGVSLLAFARLPVNLDYWVDFLPALLGFSVGLSLTVAPLTTTVLSDAGPGDAGIASGVNNAVARVAGLVAVAVLGIAAAGGGDHLTARGFHHAILAVSALLVVGGAIGAAGIRNPQTS